MSKLNTDSDFDSAVADWNSWQLIDLTGREWQKANPFQPVSPDTTTPETQPEKTKEPVDTLSVKQQRQKDLDEARENGYREGFEEGRKDGFTRGYEEVSKIVTDKSKVQVRQSLSAMQKIIEVFSDAVKGLSDNVSDDLVKLAIEIGQKLAMHTISESPEVINSVVAQFLSDETLFNHTASIYLHPEDLLIVGSHLGTEMEDLGWRLLADENISRGGCLLKSDHINIDATVGSRWDSIRARTRAQGSKLILRNADLRREEIL